MLKYERIICGIAMKLRSMLEQECPSLSMDEILGENDSVFVDTSFFFPFLNDLNPHFRRYTRDNVLGLVKYGQWQRLKSDVVNASLGDLERRTRLVDTEPKFKTVSKVASELKKIAGSYEENLQQLPAKHRYHGVRHALRHYAHMLHEAHDVMSNPQKQVASNEVTEALTQLFYELRRYYAGGARKRIRGETTDEQLFAHALHSTLFHDERSVVLTQDSDLLEILAKAKFVFLNGSSRAPFALKLDGMKFRLGYPRGSRYSTIGFPHVRDIPIPQEELDRQRGPLFTTYGEYHQHAA
jgi:hypothetical protein